MSINTDSLIGWTLPTESRRRREFLFRAVPDSTVAPAGCAVRAAFEAIVRARVAQVKPARPKALAADRGDTSPQSVLHFELS